MPRSGNTRRREAEFRLAFELARDAIFWADAATGRLIKCNRAAERLLGARRAAIIGKHQTWLHPPELREEVSRIFADHIRAGRKTHHGETFVRARGGRRIPVHISAGVVRVGKRVVIQGVFQDITERRALEAAAARQSELLRIQQDLSLDGIVVVDTKGRVLSYNRRLSQMWGLPQEALDSGSWKTVADWMAGEVADPEALLAELEGAEERRQDIVLRDGRVFEHIRRVLPDEGGRAAGHVSFFRDATASRRSEQRRAFNERAKMQRAVLSKIAHELRGPVARILGCTEALRSEPLEGRALRQEQVAAIEGQAMRLSSIVQDLLRFTKEGASRGALVPRALLLPELATAAAAAVGPAARERGVAIEVSVPPSLKVRADAAQCSRILVNLLENAVLSSRPSGWVRLEARALPGKAEVTVKSSGKAFAAEDLEWIFEPFYRGDSLGLAIAKELVELHGGRIWAEASGAETCVVRFTLPLASRRRT